MKAGWGQKCPKNFDHVVYGWPLKVLELTFFYIGLPKKHSGHIHNTAVKTYEPQEPFIFHEDIFKSVLTLCEDL